MAILHLEEFVNARTKALRSVLRPDPAYYWRKLCRWACEALNLTIFEAEKMPLNTLLRHYYEARFEDLEDDQIDKILDLVLETKEQSKAREQEEVIDDVETDEFAEMVRREAEALAKKRGEKLLTKDEAVKVSSKSPVNFNFGSPKAAPPVSTPDGAPPINLADLPPDVAMRFEDPELPDFDWDLLGKPK